MEAAVVVSSRVPGPQTQISAGVAEIVEFEDIHNQNSMVGRATKTNNSPRRQQAVSASFQLLWRFADHLRPSILDMAQIKGLNAHDRPPEAVRQCYKKYTRSSLSDIDNDPEIVDIQRLDPDQLPASITVSQYMSSQDLRLAFDDFIRGGHALDKEHAPLAENIPVFTHNAVSGQHRLASA